MEKYIQSKLESYLNIISNFKIELKAPIIIDEEYLFSSKIDEDKTENKSDEVRTILEKFKNKPVLYWLTLEEDFNKQKCLREDYETSYKEIEKLTYSYEKIDYKANQLGRRKALSAYKNSYDSNSKTLYVGKVEKGIWGRLAVHSGWGSNPKTAGLQLRHWYDFQKYGPLTFNYIVLDNSMKYFAAVLESEVRNELKPLLGKR
jgi:hypothetical protein